MAQSLSADVQQIILEVFVSTISTLVLKDHVNMVNVWITISITHTHVSVTMVSLEIDVQRTLMIVWNSHVIMVDIV